VLVWQLEPEKQTQADVAVAVLGTGAAVGTGVYEAGVVLS